MECHICGEPASIECRHCGRACCDEHRDRLCIACQDQRHQPFALLPVAFRATVIAIVVGAVINLGMAAYAWSGLGDPLEDDGPQAPAMSPTAPLSRTTATSTTSPAAASPTATATATVEPSPAASPPTSTPTEQPSVEYIVQPGDTLLDIAERFGTTVEAIQAANGLSGEDLQIDQRLTIPQG